MAVPGIVLSEKPLKNVFMSATARDMTEAERQYYERARG